MDEHLSQRRKEKIKNWQDCDGSEYAVCSYHLGITFLRRLLACGATRWQHIAPCSLSPQAAEPCPVVLGFPPACQDSLLFPVMPAFAGIHATHVLAEYSHPPRFWPRRPSNGSARDRYKAENLYGQSCWSGRVSDMGDFLQVNAGYTTPGDLVGMRTVSNWNPGKCSLMDAGFAT